MLRVGLNNIQNTNAELYTLPLSKVVLLFQERENDLTRMGSNFGHVG